MNDSHEKEVKRKNVHLVVAGASQFGQYACARVLHRTYVHSTKVTLIVARRDEQLFQNRQPAVAEWSHFSSLAKCIEQLKKDGRPIDYVFDDNIQYLVAELLKEEEDYDRIGYVATQGEEHLPYTSVLATCCDRVLIEKPGSKCVDDVCPNGLFEKLENRINERWFPRDKQQGGKIKVVTTCEHFAFRKGFSDAQEKLINFIHDHWGCGELTYEFRFFEPVEARALADRIPAMQDGSILDVGVTHGLGPLSFVLRKKLKSNSFDLHDCITWDKVMVKQARDRASLDAPLTVPVLAETAAYLEGTFKFEGAPTIHLIIESGKGGTSYERCFRFICKKHSTEEKCFFGVSLGAAGYTMYEREGKGNNELKVENVDGGWLSDRLGDSQQIAENAQAAMLENFIHGYDDRFIPIDQACQIVRLGIEAQAIGFCREREPYSLDQKIDKWPLSGKNQSDKHKNLKEVWKDNLKKPLDRLKMALGIKDGKLSAEPCFRIITIFGPEGVGNTDISEKLQIVLNNDLKKDKSEQNIAHLIKIPRDMKWCKGKGSSSFSVERVMRELGEIFKIVTDVSTDTASDLCNRVRECARAGILNKPCILIINGIDRLGKEAYTQLIRVLNELPPSVRIIMVSNRGDQACGWVIRSEELIPFLLEDIKEIAAPHREIFSNTLNLISKSISKEEVEKIEDCLKELANNNITLYQQLCCYLCYIVLPKLYKKNGKLTPDELKSIIKRELAAINLPRTVTPYPEAMLERISMVCIGSISSSPEDLRLVSSLAEVPGLIPKKFLDSLHPGLSKLLEIQRKKKSLNIRDNPLYSIFEHTSKWYRDDDPSDKGTFAIFANIRRVVCNYNGKSIQKVCAEIDRLKMLLSVNLVYEEASTNLFLEFFFNIAEESSYGFGRLDLNRGSLLESRCKELIEVLERNPTGRPDSRIHKFLASLLQQKTNLGIDTRETMVAKEAWRHLRSATTWETIIPLMEKMADACDIVQRFAPFDEAFRDPFCRVDIKGKLEEIEHDIYMMRFLASAKIALDGSWYWLYGVKTPHETRCSARLEEKVNTAREKLEKYAETNLNKKSRDKLKGKEKDFGAVILRELSLLSAHQNKENKVKLPFEFEIGRLQTARDLLLERIAEPAKPGESKKGTFIRIGINQSIMALLYLQRANLVDGEAESALESARSELAKAEEYIGNKLNLSGNPFLLLTEARFLSKEKEKLDETDKEKIKQLIRDAGNLFCRIEWDYFSELTKQMEKEFDEEKK